MLFGIFINDLTYAIKECKLLIYADNTNIYHSGGSSSTVEKALSQDLENSTTEWDESQPG